MPLLFRPIIGPIVSNLLTLQLTPQSSQVKSLKQFNFFQVDLIPGTAGESIGELDFPIESNRLPKVYRLELSQEIESNLSYFLQR